MVCKAVKLGHVKSRGKKVLGWCDKDGKRHYCCFGHTIVDTDILLDVCKSCGDNVIHMQDDNLKK